MATPLDSEFAEFDYDTKMRPYFSGSREHPDPIATILIFKDGDSAALPIAKSTNDTNYYGDLSQTVATLQLNSISTLNQPDLLEGGTIPMLNLDGEHQYYGVFNNFCLTGFTETHDQIVKIHMNFSANWNAFFFGNTPSIYQFRGYFLDSIDYPYYQEFMVAFDKYLSGRKSIEEKMRTKLMVAGQLIDGYLLNISVSHNAATVQLKEFQFTMLVKGTSWIRTNYIDGYYFDVNDPENKGYAKIDQGWRYNGLANTNRLSRNFLSGMIDASRVLTDSR